MQTPNLNEARKRTKNKVFIKDTYNVSEFQKSIGKNKLYFIKTYG